MAVAYSFIPRSEELRRSRTCPYASELCAFLWSPASDDANGVHRLISGLAGIEE